MAAGPRSDGHEPGQHPDGGGGVAASAALAQSGAMSLFAFALLAASCLQAAPGSAPSANACMPRPEAWRTLATDDDRRRVRQVRRAWNEALTEARAGGHAAELAGPLFDPDTALSDPVPPPGDYDCRTFKIGALSPGGPGLVAYPAFHCRIFLQDGRIRLVKLTGSQRPTGRLFPDIGRRMVFLGTLQLGDERQSHRYGTDMERDLAGIWERIGERRWRLAFPYPHFESRLDLIELVPRS